MSSLRDDLNSRAYASERPTGYPSLEDLSGEPPACSVCGHDEIPLFWNDLSDEYLCATCAPREGETCEGYLDRCREIRRAK